jgi:hypothetical protein
MIKFTAQSWLIKEQIIIFTLILDPEPNLEPDPNMLLFSDPAPLKQIISNPNGSGCSSTTLAESCGIGEV